VGWFYLKNKNFFFKGKRLSQLPEILSNAEKSGDDRRAGWRFFLESDRKKIYISVCFFLRPIQVSP